MTEDDTFKKLKSIPIHEMSELWENADHLLSPAGEDSEWTINSPVPKDVEDFFNRYGWTYKNFLNTVYPNHPRWHNK